MVSIENKKISPGKKIIDDVKMQIIYIPLESSYGYTYSPTKKVGDYVYIDDILGINQDANFPLKSTVSGTIVGIDKKYISNGKLSTCYVIENDFKEKTKNKLGKKKDITKYSKPAFIEMLKQSGITGMGGSDYPTFLKYEHSKKYNYLIVNGIESDILSSSDSAIMYNHPQEILECIDAIMEIMDIKKAYIAVNESNTQVIKKLLRYINTYPNIKIWNEIDAYPSSWEKHIVNNIVGESYKNSPSEIGVIVNNVSTIYAIYELLKYGNILTERVVTITGPGVKKPGNYKVKIGTNLSELMLKTDGYTKLNNTILISGGLMKGISIPEDELIITKELHTICIIENKKEDANPCIKCGKCSEVCPVGLMPVMIIDNDKKAKKLKIDKCIECGLCSYICPAKIEVREILKKIKEN